jgi:hypothetical protein
VRKTPLRVKFDRELKTKLPFDQIQATLISADQIEITLIYRGQSLMKVENCPRLMVGDSVSMSNGLRGEVDVILT